MNNNFTRFNVAYYLSPNQMTNQRKIDVLFLRCLLCFSVNTFSYGASAPIFAYFFFFYLIKFLQPVH